MQDSYRLQSSLGKVSQNTRTDLKMQGYASLAIVIKVHHKNNTADVRLIRSNNVIIGSERNEGRFSCRVLCNSANYDKDNKLSSGVVEPLVKGQLVLVSFLEGLKHEPVIVASMHAVDNASNILIDKYPLQPGSSSYDLREYKKYLRVFPTQDYVRVDGMGDIEIALHSKSFLVVSEDGVSDIHGGTDFFSLSEKNKLTGGTLTIPDGYTDEFGNDEHYYRKPKRFLFVHRDNWNDPFTTWTKFYIDDEGLFRLTRDNNDKKLFFIEVNKEGQMQMVRQKDSNAFYAGEDNTTVTLHPEGSLVCNRHQPDKVSSISISENGVVSLSRVIGGKTSSILIDEDGTISITHPSGSLLHFDNDGNITIQANKDLILKGQRILEN